MSGALVIVAVSSIKVAACPGLRCEWGKPISAAEFIRHLYGEVLPKLFKDEDELRKLWGNPHTRKALLKNLSEQGYGKDHLNDAKHMIEAEKSDLFDVLAYIAFSLAPLTRRERVNRSKDKIFNRYDDKLQVFLDFVLRQYVKEGVCELSLDKLPKLLEGKYYTLNDAEIELGNMTKIRDAFTEFQHHLYG